MSLYACHPCDKELSMAEHRCLIRCALQEIGGTRTLQAHIAHCQHWWHAAAGGAYGTRPGHCRGCLSCSSICHACV